MSYPFRMQQSCSLRKAKAETPQETPAAAEASNCDNIRLLVELWFWSNKYQTNLMASTCESRFRMHWCVDGDNMGQPDNHTLPI